MSLQSDLTWFLENDAGVSALVGSGEDARIHPVTLPQKQDETKLPAIVYRIISNPRTYSHGGYSGFQQPRVQFDIVANTHVLGIALLDAVETALKTWPSIIGCSAQIESQFEDFNRETTLYRQFLDVRFDYETDK